MDPSRAKIIEIFHQICNQYPKWTAIDKSQRDSIIIELEKGCLNESIRYCKQEGIIRTFSNSMFINVYSSYCYNVISNLNINGVVGDNYLIDHIINNPSIAKSVATYKPEQLSPKASQEERNRLDKQRHQKCTQRVSKMYTCNKCHNNSTIHFEMQLRAADELSTFRIQCVVCSHTWYVS